MISQTHPGRLLAVLALIAALAAIATAIGAPAAQYRLDHELQAVREGALPARHEAHVQPHRQGARHVVPDRQARRQGVSRLPLGDRRSLHEEGPALVELHRQEDLEHPHAVRRIVHVLVRQPEGHQHLPAEHALMNAAPGRARGWRVATRAAAGAVLATALAGAALTLAAPAASAAPGPRCFGAAAFDPDLACANMTRKAVPGLEAIGIAAPCEPVRSKLESLCAFGVAPRRAVRHVALLGDSHAMNWRGALNVVARDRRWRAYSVSMPGCLFSTAVSKLAEGRREPSRRWVRSVRSWLGDHPEVSTLFVAHNAVAPITPGAGERYDDVMLAGWTRTWTELPDWVKKIVVLRDAPIPAADTLRCLRRVLAAATRRPGPACATPRADAVKWDSAVSAAVDLRSKRYRFVDLTSFFCGAQLLPRHRRRARLRRRARPFHDRLLEDPRAVPAARSAPPDRRLVAARGPTSPGRATSWRLPGYAQ